MIGAFGRDRIVAGALAAASLVVYACALPPSYAFWDTGELQTVASILGIEHPPGSPAFVLLAWAFARVLPLGEVAWRVNLFSSLAVALSVGLLYATMRRLAITPIVGALCASAFAFSTTTLLYATRAEVHDLALCFSACALYFVVRYRDSRAPSDLFFCSFATGALFATHGVALFLLPALMVVVLGSPWPRERMLAAWAAIAAGTVLGLAPYAYIAPRSAWLFAHHVDPTLQLGLGPGLPFWDYGHPATFGRFLGFVTGAEFHVSSGFAGYLDPLRYVAYAGALVRRIGAAYGIVATILAAFGAAVLIVRRDFAGKALVLAALLPVPYTEAYADLQDPDRYYLLALWCAAIAIAVAFECLVAALRTRRARVLRAGAALGLALAFIFAAPDRGRIFSQRNDYTAPQYVEFLRSVTPDDAVVLAEWAYSSPLAYASYVEKSFGRRIGVPSAPTQYAAHFPMWLAQKRPLYIVTFDERLVLPPFRLQRVTTDQSYNVYRVLP